MGGIAAAREIKRAAAPRWDLFSRGHWERHCRIEPLFLPPVASGLAAGPYTRTLCAMGRGHTRLAAALLAAALLAGTVAVRELRHEQRCRRVCCAAVGGAVAPPSPAAAAQLSLPPLPLQRLFAPLCACFGRQRRSLNGMRSPSRPPCSRPRRPRRAFVSPAGRRRQRGRRCRSGQLSHAAQGMPPLG